MSDHDTAHGYGPYYVSKCMSKVCEEFQSDAMVHPQLEKGQEGIH